MLTMLTFGVAACGQSASQVTFGDQPPTAAGVIAPLSADPPSDHYDTPLERRNGRLRVRPVPESYRPKISKTEALEVFKEQRLFPETAERGTPDVRLGRYTSDQLSVTWPPVQIDRPVWVIRYDNVSPEAGSPGWPPPGPGQDTPANSPVDILVFIDADTGQYLNAVQDAAVTG